MEMVFGRKGNGCEFDWANHGKQLGTYELLSHVSRGYRTLNFCRRVEKAVCREFCRDATVSELELDGLR